MTQDNVDLSNKVLWYVYYDVMTNYQQGDMLRLNGNISFFIKGWYPPGPQFYNPVNNSNWKNMGSRTISFDVH